MPDGKKQMIRVPKRLLSDKEIESARTNTMFNYGSIHTGDAKSDPAIIKARAEKAKSDEIVQNYKKKHDNDVANIRAKGKIVNVQSGVSGKGTKGRVGYRVHYEGGKHEDIAPEGLGTLAKTVEYQDYRRGLAKNKK